MAPPPVPKPIEAFVQDGPLVLQLLKQLGFGVAAALFAFQLDDLVRCRHRHLLCQACPPPTTGPHVLFVVSPFHLRSKEELILVLEALHDVFPALGQGFDQDMQPLHTQHGDSPEMAKLTNRVSHVQQVVPGAGVLIQRQCHLEKGKDSGHSFLQVRQPVV